MWFVHHFLRVIWANVLGFFFWIYYSFRNGKAYRENLAKWDGISSVSELVDFFRQTYAYKWDGYKGLFDHNNSKKEFFSSFGDCEDVGWYACQKLRQILKGRYELCSMYGFADLSAKPKFWHYDCIFRLKDDDIYYLFNYGHLNKTESVEDAAEVMTMLYSKSYKFKKMKVWKCLWR